MCIFQRDLTHVDENEKKQIGEEQFSNTKTWAFSLFW